MKKVNGVRSDFMSTYSIENEMLDTIGHFEALQFNQICVTQKQGLKTDMETYFSIKWCYFFIHIYYTVILVVF